jgi:hypothetical protein
VISTLDDMRMWVSDLAIGKLISPAMKRERDRFLPAPALGETALYGLAIENQNGWIGHHGNTPSGFPGRRVLKRSPLRLRAWYSSRARRSYKVEQLPPQRW